MNLGITEDDKKNFVRSLMMCIAVGIFIGATARFIMASPVQDESMNLSCYRECEGHGDFVYCINQCKNTQRFINAELTPSIIGNDRYINVM